MPFVDQESLAGGEQERPESATLGVDGLKRPQLEQSLEERLSKILCFVYITHSAANVRVKRISIRLTKLGKGPTRIWPSSIAADFNSTSMARTSPGVLTRGAAATPSKRVSTATVEAFHLTFV